MKGTLLGDGDVSWDHTKRKEKQGAEEHLSNIRVSETCQKETNQLGPPRTHAAAQF